MAVTPAEVAAAKLTVKRAKQKGLGIDPAIEAIANAGPWPRSQAESDDDTETARP